MPRKPKKTQKALLVSGRDMQVSSEAFRDVSATVGQVVGGDGSGVQLGVGEWYSATATVSSRLSWYCRSSSSAVPYADTPSRVGDPRSVTSLIRFAQAAPFEYRQQLTSAGQNRRRFASIFTFGSVQRH